MVWKSSKIWKITKNNLQNEISTFARSGKGGFFGIHATTQQEMKTILATTLLTVATVASGFAQSIYFDNLYGDFKEQEEAVTMTVTGSLLSLVSFFADDEESQEVMSELGKSIDMIKMVMMEEGQTLSDRDLDDLKRMITTKEGFEELMVMRDGEQTVDVFAIEKDGVMKEIILIVRESEEMILMDIWGEIDLKNINQIVEAIDMD